MKGPKLPPRTHKREEEDFGGSEDFKEAVHSPILPKRADKASTSAPKSQGTATSPSPLAPHFAAILAAASSSQATSDIQALFQHASAPFTRQAEVLERRRQVLSPIQDALARFAIDELINNNDKENNCSATQLLGELLQGLAPEANALVSKHPLLVDRILTAKPSPASLSLAAALMSSPAARSKLKSLSNILIPLVPLQDVASESISTAAVKCLHALCKFEPTQCDQLAANDDLLLALIASLESKQASSPSILKTRYVCLVLDKLGLSTRGAPLVLSHAPRLLASLVPLYHPLADAESRLWATGVIEGLARSRPGAAIILSTPNLLASMAAAYKADAATPASSTAFDANYTLLDTIRQQSTETARREAYNREQVVTWVEQVLHRGGGMMGSMQSMLAGLGMSGGPVGGGGGGDQAMESLFGALLGKTNAKSTPTQSPTKPIPAGLGAGLGTKTTKPPPPHLN